MKQIYALIFVLALGFTSVPTSASQGPDEWTGGCLAFTKNLYIGNRDIGRSSDVRKLQQFLNYQQMLKMSPTGYFGTATAKAVRDYQKQFGLKQTGVLNAETRNIMKGSTCIGVSAVTAANTASAYTIRTELKGTQQQVGGAVYQVNLSFGGGVPNTPVKEWKMTFVCPEHVTIATVPGDACGEFSMGVVHSFGNIYNKPFWIKNSTGKMQVVRLRALALTNNGMILGATTETTINVPPTALGPQSSSQVTVLSPNDGGTYIAGEVMDVLWKTSPGYFNLNAPEAKVNIKLLDENRMVVHQVQGLVNDGFERISLPRELGAGTNYKIDVAVHLPEGGQMDQSDGVFMIIK